MPTKIIPGFPEYTITTSGEVYRNGRQKKPQKHRNGHWTISLWKDGKRTRTGVGRLVLLTFIGEPEADQVCCHGPEGRSIHDISNVYWGTLKRNNGPDKVRDGTLLRGERHGRSKLTQQQAEEIRAKYKSTSTSQRKLAKEYGVCQATIRDIVIGKSYSQ